MRTTALNVLSFAAAAMFGCSPQLRAIPADAQHLIRHGRGLMAHQDDITVSAVHVPYPPIAAEREYLAFAVSMQNSGRGPVVIDPNRMRLALVAGNERMERAPIAPDDLIRAYQAAVAHDSPVYAQVIEPELVGYVRCGHRGRPCYGRTCYVYRPYYYYPGHYGYYHDVFNDAYRWRQETASFLARLLRPQMVLRDTVLDGFVVFGQRAEKGDRYVLTVPVQIPAPGSEAVTQPVTLPPGRDLAFEFHYLAK